MKKGSKMVAMADYFQMKKQKVAEVKQWKLRFWNETFILNYKAKPFQWAQMQMKKKVEQRF